MDKEFRPGIPPSSLKEDPTSEDYEEEVIGLERAINKTKETIAKHKPEGSDVYDLESNLKDLERRLEEAQKKVKPH